MQIFRTIDELVLHLKTNIWGKEELGLVPTMGAIHEGHLSLVKHSLGSCDYTLTSIFVNPAQFNNPDDLLAYPRSTEIDIEKLEDARCSAVFIPSADEIYPDTDFLKIDFGRLEKIMEGKYRPGHFSGVGVIISKLFNLIRPNTAFFGQKDLQQVAVIKKLVRDLNFMTKVNVVETLRESTGLAMSSRNLRLSEEGLNIAAKIYQCLQILREKIILTGDIKASLVSVKGLFQEFPGLDLEYLEVVDSNNLITVSSLDQCDEVSACTAVHVEGVRLIDNIYVKQSNL